jgi:hypothetical protein
MRACEPIGETYGKNKASSRRGKRGGLGQSIHRRRWFAPWRPAQSLHIRRWLAGMTAYRWRLCVRETAPLAAALLCSGCVWAGRPSYTASSGTASLQWSGSASKELASYMATLADCGGNPDLTLMYLGSMCRITFLDGNFTPDPKTPCVLPFGPQVHKVHVTDVNVRFSSMGRYINWGSPDFEVGADDIATGTHAIYILHGGWMPLPATLFVRTSDDKPNICPGAPPEPPTPPPPPAQGFSSSEDGASSMGTESRY